MKQLKLLTLCLALVSLMPFQSLAQKLSKVSQSIKVNKDVTIDLNTSFCNIEFDSWNKDIVEIEAYIEGEKLSKEELQKALEKWDVDIDATSNHITITTNGNLYGNWDFRFPTGDHDAAVAAIKELKFELAELPEMPKMPELPAMPELPPLPEGINQFHFDYEAYKKDGDKYVEEWSKAFGEKFDKEWVEKMEAWGEKFGEEFGEKFGEEWGEKYAKQMEAWAERFENRIEREVERNEELKQRMKEREKHMEERKIHRDKEHVERMELREEQVHERRQLAEERRARVEELINSSSEINSKVKKSIKIKMPKNAKLKVNVKHGELKFASNISNLKADLVHTKFTANSINGSSTSINASYAPVLVTDWNLGELNLNYVEDAKISNVKHLVLTSNSSSVIIDKVITNAIIDGSFGELKILNVDDNFTGMNVILHNSDMVMVLPKTNYNLQFRGNQSFLKHPKNSNKEILKQYKLGDLTSEKTIVLNTKFSNVKLQ